MANRRYADGSVKLGQVLELVGPLDDAPGDTAARVRFRQYLWDSVRTIGAVRDYVQECLQTSGPQYSRALQDLVNHTARLIGFEVEFGRYAGVQGEVGFDGIWRSDELAVVVEVKTTDVYAIKTAILLNYINGLVSAKRIANADNALGLYVVGRLDPELKQLENAIVAEKRTQQLRLVTVDSVLSMAELVQDGYISKEEARTLLKPGSVVIDDAVRLIARVASMSSEVDTIGEAAPLAASTAVPVASQPLRATATPIAATTHPLYLITPVSDNEQGTIRETLAQLLGQGWYVFGDRTPGRKDLQPGDRICFYATTRGVVAEAEVASAPELGTVEGVRYPDRFPWRFKMRDARFFDDKPIVIDAELRSGLDAFQGPGPCAVMGVVRAEYEAGQFPRLWPTDGTDRLVAGYSAVRGILASNLEPPPMGWAFRTRRLRPLDPLGRA